MWQRLIFFVSLLVAVIMAGMAWQRWRATQTLAVDCAAARGEIVQLTQRLDDLRRVRAAEARAKAAPAEIAAKALESQRTLQEFFQAEAQKRSEALRNELLSTPSFQVLHEQSATARYRDQFAVLFRRLNLSSGQQNAFVGALVKAEMLKQDLDALARAKGLSRDDPEIEARRTAADADAVHEIEAVLGSNALSVTREYTRMDQIRSYVASYGGLFSRIGEPLTFDQGEALTAAFGQVSHSTAPGRFSVAEWERVWAEAERILTSAQWREFQSATPSGEMSSRWETAVKEALAKAGAPEKN